MPENTKEPNGRVKLSGPEVLFQALLAGVFVVGLVLVFFIFSYALANTDRAERWGPIGDFIGGTLNPLLTFLTFVGVLVSIFLQRMELSLSRAELKRSADALEKQIESIEAQNFETTFTQLLQSLNSLTDSIDLRNPNTDAVTSGKDCFRVFYTRLNKKYRSNLKKAVKNHSNLETLRLSYQNFWKENHQELGHYFRFLYNVYRFLDSSSAAQDYHFKLLRAQLSDHELLLIFYNCHSKAGRNFVDMATKYEIFDNMPTVLLLEDSHIELMDRCAFGNNPLYTSKNAREQH